MKRILLVSDGWIHPPYRGRAWLKEALTELPDYSFDETASLDGVAQQALGEYDALVLYYHHMNDTLAAADLEAFGAFVKNGGGALAVHSATASYKPTAGYFEILGGRFIGHGPVQAFESRPSQDDDPIFAGIGAFTVEDELYLHELQPDIEAHFVADHEGKPTPVVWTRSFGGGRVCYVCFGHRSASMKNPAVREILKRGMRWVCEARPGE